MAETLAVCDPLAVGDSLAALYRHIHMTSMADMPLSNPALDVASVGFRVEDEAVFGIVITPWFMNLVCLPASEAPRARPGESVTRGLPAGLVTFTAGELDGFGPLETCSLFSPMFEFADMPAALATAEAAMAELFAPPAPEEPAPPPPPPALDRRALFLRRAPDREART